MKIISRSILASSIAICSLTLATSTHATLIANLFDDYSPTVNGVTTPGGTWTYLWNQPDGWIGGATTGAPIGDITTGPLNDPSKFMLFQNGGSHWTADGNTNGTDSNPDRFLRLGNPNATFTTLNLHPGAQQSFNVGAGGDVNGNQINGHDRYVITAFTVSSAASYQVTGGELYTGNANSNGVDVWAFATGQVPIQLGASAGGTNQGTAFNFNHDLGPLNPGDTIYVAFGTNGNPGNDASFTDFSISAIPEPSVLSMMLLGLIGLSIGRRFVQ